MQFPIDITLKLGGWRARLRLSDSAGETLGFARLPKGKDGRWALFADESESREIYIVRWEHGLSHWFEDRQGRKLGSFGVMPGEEGKVVSVAGVPSFRFVDETPGLDSLDKWIPNLPLLNGITGALVKPRMRAVRTDGGAGVARIIKTRLMVDVRYTLVAFGRIDGREMECLILGAVLQCLQDHLFSFDEWMWRA